MSDIDDYSDKSDSDILMGSALLKKSTKKPPKSPTTEMLRNQEPKKLSTKTMIHQALLDLHSRKGVSLYAIKKHMEEKHKIDPEKISYYIKKSIKKEVELGTIVQTKGIGASGSFKLASTKPKTDKKKVNKEKVKDPPKIKTKITENAEKPKKKSKSNEQKPKPADENKITKKKVETTKMEKKPKVAKVEKPKTKKNVMAKEMKLTKPSKIGNTSQMAKDKVQKVKTSKTDKAPANKSKLMQKRKSIGTIIKPPKMKPKARD